MKIYKVKNLHSIYYENKDNDNESRFLYRNFDNLEISLVKVLAPTNQSLYGLSLYPNLLGQLNKWAVKSHDDLYNYVLSEYESLSVKAAANVPTSLNPKVGWTFIDIFIPTKFIDSLIDHFQTQEEEFGNDSFIENQWSLSSGLDSNYQDFLSFDNHVKNLNTLKSLYLNLLSDKNHPLLVNKKIRKQVNLSLSLTSMDSNFKLKIIENNAVVIGIVNLLKWPNLYANTELIKREFPVGEYENVEVNIEDKNINFKNELDAYLSYIEKSFPSVLFKIDWSQPHDFENT